MNVEFLEHENDPEVLRQFSQLALGEIYMLQKELAQLKNSLLNEDQLRLIYEDRLCRLKSKLFGHGIEKLDKSLKPKKNADLLLHGESANPDEDHQAKKTAKDRALSGESFIYPMSDLELKEEAHMRGFLDAKPKDWKELENLYDEATEITIVERVYKKVTHKRKKYIYVPSIGTEKEVIVTAKGPEKLYPGCGYSLDFAIATVCDKYQHHSPLNRQVEQMEQKGLTGITAKTLYGLAEGLAAHAVDVLKTIKKDIYTIPLAIHADETPWPILDDKDSDGYMWVIANMAGSYYCFEPSRSGRVIADLLKGYEGPVMSDDFKGYDRLKKQKGIVLCHCWAHARRNFYEISNNHKEDCREILGIIDELFEVEREAKTWDALKQLRESKSRPIIAKMETWLKKKNAKYILSEDEMGKSIRYILNNWPEFTAFLDDIRVPLSNNEAERALRHAVLGRKNFNGSKTINGADVAAVHYTIIETCKKVQLDPAAYYRYLVTTMNAKKEEPMSPLGYVRWKYEQKLQAQKEAAGP